MDDDGSMATIRRLRMQRWTGRPACSQPAAVVVRTYNSLSVAAAACRAQRQARRRGGRERRGGGKQFNLLPDVCMVKGPALLPNKALDAVAPLCHLARVRTQSCLPACLRAATVQAHRSAIDDDDAVHTFLLRDATVSTAWPAISLFYHALELGRG